MLVGGKLKIAVVGLGKLGLPLCLTLADAGHELFGIDKNQSLIDSLNSGEYTSKEPKINEFMVEHGNQVIFTNQYGILNNIETIYLILPTPSNDKGEFLNDFLIDAIEEIGLAWRKSKKKRVLIVVSTVMPGVTRNILQPALEKYSKEKIGESLQIIYSPEFIAIGSIVENLQNPDMLLIGAENEWAESRHFLIMSSLFKKDVVTKVLNFEEAELVKLFINNYITMKISFSNYVAEVSELLTNVNAIKITNAIGIDSRIGNKYLRPGLGYGGPCFPRDTRAIEAFARSYNWPSELSRAVNEINLRQPKVSAYRIVKNFDKFNKIGVYGLSYKSGSDLTEESQAVSFCNELIDYGLEVFAYDPLISLRPPELNKKVTYSEKPETLQNCEILICTQALYSIHVPALEKIPKIYI